MDVWTQFFHPCEGFKSSEPYPRDGNIEPEHDKCLIKCRAHLFREALRRICYDVPNFSHFKALALNAGDIPVPQASEWFASYNCADVVKWSLIPKSWLFVVYYFNNIIYFFLFLHMQITLQDLTYAACGLWVILDQATDLVGHSRS